MRAELKALVALALLGASGCSVVVGGDLDPLELDLNGRRDVSILLDEFVPHEGQPMVIEFFRPDTNFVQAAARIDPMPASCIEVTLPLGATNGATMVDFYVDADLDGLDAPMMGMGDHQWREELDESGRLVFQHGFDFTDLTGARPNVMGGDLVIDLTGFDAMNDSSAVVSFVQRVNLAGPMEEPVLRDSISAVYSSSIIDGNVGPRHPAPVDGPPRIRGLADGGVTYTIELNIGDGAMRCTLESRAPATGDFTVTAALGDFDCGDQEPFAVYRDCSR